MIAIGRQMTVNFRSPIPVFRQIADILPAQIDTEELPADEQMPSRRELQERYGVARGTVTRALQRLKDEGRAYVVSGKGAYPYAKDKRPRRRSNAGPPISNAPRRVTRRRHDLAGHDRPRGPAPRCDRALRSLTQ